MPRACHDDPLEPSLEALRVCGIYVEHAAAEQMIDWLRKQEQRQGGDLGIVPGLAERPFLVAFKDLPRFINLFNHVTDMLAKARAPDLETP